MLLKEMFSPVGGPKDEEQDVDWIDDLKFYIDNENRLLNNYIFPTVAKHKKHVGNPNVYKLYVQALKPCIKDYCKTFNIEDPDEKFPENAIINLARSMATTQENFIKKGDYDKDL